MILKKFHGDTVKEARTNAEKALGEDCVILESTKATGDHKATVTVMMDKRMADPDSAAPDAEPKGGGTYSRKDGIPASLGKIKDSVSKGISRLSDEMTLEAAPPAKQPSEAAKQAGPAGNAEAHTPQPTLTMSRRSTPLYRPQAPQQRQQHAQNDTAGVAADSTLGNGQNPVSQQVKALHRRFDHMENLLSETMISANLNYISHPAFQQLLKAGIQAPTISKWFEQILSKGIDPHQQNQSFMFELADIVRSSLDFAIPEAPERNLLFVGPAGAGKTTLIMKLAAHTDFMQNKSVALVSVEPKSPFRRYSILEPFAADHNIPFHRVTDGVDMSTLLEQLDRYDHVLYDTPSISLQQQAGFRDFWRIRQLLSSVAPLEVHYAVNATLESYYFNESYAANHPLQPDYIAVTHLDETQKWGHLIPFIREIGASVRYVSQGPHIPDNLHTFKPEWFAEKILS